MKILHIINNLGSGGAEKLLSDSLPLMDKINNIEVEVLLLTDCSNVFEENLRKNSIKISVIKIKQIKNPLNVIYIRNFIKKGKYDIVHAHIFPTLYWVSMASKLIMYDKPKFIYTEHSTHNQRRENKHFRYLEKWIYFNFDKIISISKQAQKNLLHWLIPNKKNRKKFKVIENGIDIDQFKEAKPYKKQEINSQLDENTKIICMVGRFSKAKDQNTLIKAIGYLPNNIQLLLVGEGSLKMQSEMLANEIGVKDRVHFLGFREDVKRIIKTSDIIVLSSHWEGFGLAAVEGMAAGKPVIASDVEGLRSVVKGAGILLEKGSSKELSEQIQFLLSNNKKYEEVRKKCIEKVDAYSIHNMVKKYISTYQGLYIEKRNNNSMIKKEDSNEVI